MTTTIKYDRDLAAKARSGELTRQWIERTGCDAEAAGITADQINARNRRIAALLQAHGQTGSDLYRALTRKGA